MSKQVSQPDIAVDAAEAKRKRTFERNKWIFSTSGVGRDMSYQLIATFLLTYIQFGISLSIAQFTALGIIIGVGGRIWDAANDPLMGAIIEGTHLKSGKFRPWILIGALSCGLAIMLMFNVQNIPGWNFVVFMSIMYLVWETTFTMNDIGYWSMLPSLSSKTKERNSVTMLTVLFAAVGSVLAQGVIPMITTGNMRAGYRFVGTFVALVFMISQVITFFGVKESPRSDAEKDDKVSLKKMWETIKQNDQILWLTLSMLFYNIGSMLLITCALNVVSLELGYNGTLYTIAVAAYGIPSIFANAFYPKISEKISRKKIQKISIAIACVGYGLLALAGWTSILPINIVLLSITIFLIATGQTIFYLASIVNMTNCVEYNDYKLGKRNEAVVSTLRPFMAKFASAMEYVIVIALLTISGIYGLSQSISSLEAQRDFFSSIETVDAQVYYIEQVQAYIGEFDGLKEGTAEYNNAVKKVDAMINADEVMNKYKLDAKYVSSIGDSIIMITSTGDNGKASTPIEVGRLKDISPLEIYASSQSTAKYSMEVGDVASESESAANLNFRDKASTGMRIGLRFTVTIVPMAMLLLSLLVQNKKFIIDEDYYEMMLDEIEKRKAK